MTTLERLQSWYLSQCDGDWEHQSGVHIDTIDNPGWRARISLTGTSIEKAPFESIRDERTEDNWIHAWIDVKDDKTVFNIACGPENLAEALKMFCDWAEVKDRP
jgi:hypothetical protein